MNKKGVLVAIVVAILCLGIGFGCSYMLLKSNVNETKCESPKEEKTSEEEYIEKIFKNTDIALKNEKDIEEFIFSTNQTRSSSFIVGAIYDEKMSDLFKLAYTIRKIFPYEEGIPSIYSIKKSVLEEAVSQVFADFSMEYNVSLNFDFVGTYGNLMCVDDTCYIEFWHGGGLTGIPDEYTTKIINVEEEDDKIIYTVKNIYVDYEFKGENKTIEDANITTTLRTDAASTDSLYIFDGILDGNYDKLVEKVDETKLNTYKIIFDKDNRYLRTEKVK